MNIRMAMLVLSLLFGSVSTAVAVPNLPASISDVKEKLQTQRNQAWFWSGTCKNDKGALISVAPTAKRLAARNGGYTLDRKMREQDIPFPPDGPYTWDQLSGWFAEGARGKARGVLGRLNPDNVWERIEYPTLLRNPNIESVWRVDPVTYEEIQIWPTKITSDEACSSVDPSSDATIDDAFPSQVPNAGIPALRHSSFQLVSSVPAPASSAPILAPSGAP